MRIDFENIKESELDSDTIIIDENEASFHQHIHDLFFIKKPLNAETWYSFIIKNFRRVLKLTVAFVIHGDPEKLARNAEDLSEYLLGLYREYFPIRWQANILQIKYLNQHHQPLKWNSASVVSLLSWKLWALFVVLDISYQMVKVVYGRCASALLLIALTQKYIYTVEIPHLLIPVWKHC
jgi:hypothetical protein